MKSLSLLALVCFIAGCSSPTLGFIGAESREVQMNGLTFSIFRKEDSVQVIRTGFATFQQQRQMRQMFVEVVESTTNCAVILSSMSGDVAVFNADVACDDRDETNAS